MSKLPPQTKILREDVKDAPPWVSKIIDPFNSLASTMYNALNRNLTFSENLACFVKEITYKTTSAYPVEVDVSFTNELKFKATGLILLQAVERTTYDPPPGPVYVPWTEENGLIVVKPITGLVASKTYTIRLLVS